MTVDGRFSMQQQKRDGVAIGVTLEPGERAEIRIFPEQNRGDSKPQWKPTSGHNVRVLIRRVLSEVRDDRVETNKFFDGLLSGAHRLRARGAVKV